MLTTLLLFALAQRQRPTMPTQPVAGWKIEISTDGGIAGSGSGGLIVTSDGSLTIILLSGKRCTHQLTPDELRTIDNAVRNTQPGAWLECYSLADVNTHCCDLIRTTLSVAVGNSRYVTSWLTGASPFPQDLKDLVDVLRGPAGVDARYRALCTP